MCFTFCIIDIQLHMNEMYNVDVVQNNVSRNNGFLLEKVLG